MKETDESLYIGLKRKASTPIDLPTKRAKTSEAALAKLAASQNSLSMFIDMPMDVLTEVRIFKVPTANTEFELITQ